MRYEGCTDDARKRGEREKVQWVVLIGCIVTVGKKKGPSLLEAFEFGRLL